MRKILVIGRNWQEIDTWMNTANDRFAGAELDGMVLDDRTRERLLGRARGCQVVLLPGAENHKLSDLLLQWLAMRSAVFLNP